MGLVNPIFSPVMVWRVNLTIRPVLTPLQVPVLTLVTPVTRASSSWTSCAPWALAVR